MRTHWKIGLFALALVAAVPLRADAKASWHWKIAEGDKRLETYTANPKKSNSREAARNLAMVLHFGQLQANNAPEDLKKSGPAFKDAKKFSKDAKRFDAVVDGCNWKKSRDVMKALVKAGKKQGVTLEQTHMGDWGLAKEAKKEPFAKDIKKLPKASGPNLICLYNKELGSYTCLAIRFGKKNYFVFDPFQGYFYRSGRTAIFEQLQKKYKEFKFNRYMLLKIGGKDEDPGASSEDDAGFALKPGDWGSEAKQKSREEQFADDIKMWTNVIHPPSGSKKKKEIREITARIFALYATGGVMYRKKKDVKKWSAFPFPTASLLSHGGRLLIAARKDAKLGGKAAVQRWIVTGSTKGQGWKEISGIIETRKWSTHGIGFSDNKIKETKGKISAVKGRTMSDRSNFGLNVPVGGFGSFDSQGNPVEAKGAHGHVLVFCRRGPSENKVYNEGVLIGCEGSAPGVTNQFGDAHTAAAKSSPTSPTGGMKWKALQGGFAAEDTLRIVIYDKKQLSKAASLAKKLLKSRDEAAKALGEKPKAGKAKYFKE